MTDIRPQDLGENPTVEARIYREGKLVHRELCESEEEAADVVAIWAEMDGVHCDIVSLSAEQHDTSRLEFEPDVPDDRDFYPAASERQPGW